MTDETRRFNWPIPSWDADWSRWQQIFTDFANNVDATIFAASTNAKLIIKQLPNVEVKTIGSDWYLSMGGDALFVSRALLTEIRVPAEDVKLEVNSVLAITFTPGAVGPQVAAWEVFTSGLDASPDVIPLGYVDDSFNIIWFNGAELAAGGGVQGLFEFPGGSGSSSDKVRVSYSDTLAKFLGDKIAAGTNVTLTTLNPGGDEQLEINVPTSSVVTGTDVIFVDAQNGNDVTGNGTMGTPYATLAYACTTIGAPVDWTEFNTPIVFDLAPGTYPDAVTLPYRRVINITGDQAKIEGKITWGYDVQYWYGHNTLERLGMLSISPRVRLGVVVSEIDSVNDAPSNGSVLYRWMWIDNCFLAGSILNKQSGATGAGESTGALLLNMTGCSKRWPYSGLNAGVIGGERESGYSADANYVLLMTSFTQVPHKLYGCVGFYSCSFTQFLDDIDYEMDPVNVTSGYAGAIGGSGAGFDFRDCSFSTNGNFGWDGATGSTPGDVRVDANTYGELEASTYDNIELVRKDVAAGVEVDDSSHDNLLEGDTSSQECFDTIDDLPFQISLSVDTTDATPTELINALGRVMETSGSVGAAFLDMEIMAKRYPTNDDIVTWKIQAVFTDDSGTRQIVASSITKTRVYETSNGHNEADWDVDLDYYNASGTPRIRVLGQGYASVNIRWNANVRVVFAPYDVV